MDQISVDNVKNEEEEIFSASKYELMEKLVHSDAVSHVIDLEQRMRNERRIVVKNREISLQKMNDRHKKEISQNSSPEELVRISQRHEDDKKRIEEHFHQEVKTLESKEMIKIKF